MHCSAHAFKPAGTLFTISCLDYQQRMGIAPLQVLPRIDVNLSKYMPCIFQL